VSLGLALVMLATLTLRQIGFWHDSVRVYEHAISVEDGDYMRGLPGTALIAERRYADAEPHLRTAVRLARNTPSTTKISRTSCCKPANSSTPPPRSPSRCGWRRQDCRGHRD